MCHKCHAVFQDNDTKHHCRACGEGFCDGCSSRAAPVPERGWGLAPVRVCDVCFEQRASYAGERTLGITSSVAPPNPCTSSKCFFCPSRADLRHYRCKQAVIFVHIKLVL